MLAATPMLRDFFMNGTTCGRGEGALGGSYPYYTTYETADNKLLSVGCTEPWLWENFCQAIGREDLAQSSQFALAVDLWVLALILLLALPRYRLREVGLATAVAFPVAIGIALVVEMFRIPSLPFAVGVYLPVATMVPVVIGGLLSTMSALNATVMASSRVAFSMGRDRWLPDAMAEIHPEKRTPHIAIFVTGVILLAMALTLPIEAVGSAASLIFLLTFAMVNLSVIVLRRKEPDLPRRYRVPLYPIVPVLGIVLNVFLALYQFSFQPIAWYVTLGWVAVLAVTDP